jgi:hypothetical protein
LYSVCADQTTLFLVRLDINWEAGTSVDVGVLAVGGVWRLSWGSEEEARLRIVLAVGSLSLPASRGGVGGRGGSDSRLDAGAGAAEDAMAAMQLSAI